MSGTRFLGLRWAVRDLRGGLAGLRLLFICLMLGVAAIAGVGSLSASIVAGLADKGQSLLGGDLELRLTQRTATPAEQQAFGRLGEVSETARLRAMARNPVTGGAQLVELKAVDAAYPLYGRFGLTDARALQPAIRSAGAVIDPLLARRLGLKVGDTVQIGEGRFTVRGLIADEPDRASEGFALGPSVLIAMDDFVSTGLVQPGSLIRYHYRIKMPATVDPAAAEAGLNSRFPEAGWQARNRTRAAPGLERFVDQLGQFLTLVGLTALMVAGVGVGNGVSAYLARKSAAIATWKSLGASSGLIFRVYLLELAMVGGVAILFGLMLGALVPAVGGRLLAEQLPAAPATGLFFWPLFSAAVSGALVALVFALGPLMRARAVPAARLFRDAVEDRPRMPLAALAVQTLAVAIVVGLAVWGAAQPLLAAGFVAAAGAVLLALRGVGWLVARLAARLPRPRHPVTRLAIANLHRPGAATAQVVMGLGLGLSLFATLAVIEANMTAQIRRTLPDTAPAFFLLDIAPDQVAAFRRTVAAVPGVGAVETVPSLRGPVTHVNGVPAEQLKPAPEVAWILRGDRGLTYTAEVPEGNVVTSGAWWPRDYAGPPLISLDEEVARGLGIGVGDTVSVSVLGVDVTARIANLRRVDWESLGFNFAMLFAPGTLEQAPHTYMATVEAEGDAEPAVFRLVSERYPTVSIVRMKETLVQVGALLGQISVAVRAMGSVTIVAGVLVLIGAIAAGRQAKTYDSVLLKLLGATRPQILASLALEYAVLGLVTGVVALGLGLTGGWFVVTRVLELGWQWAVLPPVLTVIAGAVFTLIIGLAGTWSVLGVRPNQVLRAA
ncbi:ABC transporter permease [Parapedomonas caeni]